ncbi:hypothetical protein CERZMDRAFT_30825, partial [Cercospora zeae-maydis SCOH1-5]
MRLRHVAQPSLRRITRRYPWTQHMSLLTSAITLLWLYFIHAEERGTPHAHITTCDWRNWESWHRDAQPHRSVFVADPQLVDPHTYPGRPWPLSSLTEFYTDLYMQRNFKLINQELDPDSIVFLGDLLDGGREWSTERARSLNTDQRQYKQQQWDAEYDRFARIFLTEEQLYPGVNRSFRILKASLPGNHDLGFGSGVQVTVRDRFESHFGEANTIYVLGNHTFVSLDTPSLSAYDEFAIPLSAGYQYQNVLTPSLTSIIGKKVSAAGDMVHIFSGDDHDYCDVDHRFNVGRYNDDTKKEHVVMRTVREVTVKSFSWAMGVRKPAFLLVSLWNPVDEQGRHVGECMGGVDGVCKTVQTELCLLPDQLSVFISYAQLLGLTIIVLFVRSVVI